MHLFLERMHTKVLGKKEAPAKDEPASA